MRKIKILHCVATSFLQILRLTSPSSIKETIHPTNLILPLQLLSIGNSHGIMAKELFNHSRILSHLKLITRNQAELLLRPKPFNLTFRFARRTFLNKNFFIIHSFVIVTKQHRLFSKHRSIKKLFSLTNRVIGNHFRGLSRNCYESYQ